MSEEKTPVPEGGNPVDNKSGGGSDFEPITTQEEFDKRFNHRWAREKVKYDGFDEFKQKAEKFDALDEQNKTELQKVLERAEKAEKALAEKTAKEQIAAWAKEVSTETGVPADVLRGSTKEELMEHAEALKPAYTTEKTKTPPDKGGAPPATEQGTDWLREAIKR